MWQEEHEDSTCSGMQFEDNRFGRVRGLLPGCDPELEHREAHDHREQRVDHGGDGPGERGVDAERLLAEAHHVVGEQQVHHHDDDGEDGDEP